MQNYYDFNLRRIGWRKQGVYRQISSAKDDLVKNKWGILRYIVHDFDTKKIQQVRILDTDTNTIHITEAKVYLEALKESTGNEEKIFVHKDKFKEINYVKRGY